MKKVYYLASFENNKFEPVEEISLDSYNSIIDSCDIIKKAHSQLVIFKYLQLNIKEYSVFIRKISAISIARINIQAFTSEAMLLDANKNVLNVLTSFIFFLDNAKTYLTRKYRNDEQLITEFEKLKSHHYDSSFAYRFLTKLRNYSIHMGMPLMGLGFNVEAIIEKPEEMIGDIIPYLDIDALKKEKKLFGGMHKEILSIGDDIDIRPLVKDLSKSILEIQKFIYSVQMTHIEDSIQSIESFTGKFKNDSNKVKLYYVSNRTNLDVELTVYDIPYAMINDFKTYKRHMEKSN